MKARIEGVGTYRIVLDMGYCLDLEKCLYVPDCFRNLVSIFRLDVLGFEFRIGHGCFSLYRGTNLCGTGLLLDTLYCFNLKCVCTVCMRKRMILLNLIILNLHDLNL